MEYKKIQIPNIQYGGFNPEHNQKVRVYKDVEDYDQRIDNRSDEEGNSFCMGQPIGAPMWIDMFKEKRELYAKFGNEKRISQYRCPWHCSVQLKVRPDNDFPNSDDLDTVVRIGDIDAKRRNAVNYRGEHYKFYCPFHYHIQLNDYLILNREPDGLEYPSFDPAIHTKLGDWKALPYTPNPAGVGSCTIC